MKGTNNGITIIASVMVIAGTTIIPLLQDQANAAALVLHRSIHSNQEDLCFRSNACRNSHVGQNTLGNDNSVTGFVDQSRNTPTATLTVNKHVKCSFTSGCPAAGQFNIIISTNSGSSFSCTGSERGTSLTLATPFPIAYKVTEDNPLLGVIIATIPVGPAAIGIAFNPNNGNMYVANVGATGPGDTDKRNNIITR